MKYVALDITANCISKIRSLALEGFNFTAVHKLSSKEKKISTELGFKPRAAGWEERMLLFCPQVSIINEAATGLLRYIPTFLCTNNHRDIKI